ncbi:pyridine nucleotide-disulfide oxidoreductase [Pseudoclavibacter sp. RFBJ3]|uniref:dihydrolipoyl dehydrogenase family protein n=1 Tax=unclassified Pseudoclavibacter TaxID=2615177 RepID=UPI000CE745F1|nr:MULTISPECIES: NAD(P)/FAD-dependent oxidoreductase [unclassified Pseudoclavibacter]PPF84277.1 pyridine nucleotide-disulfide oxidoreductase [Pseudoclavibacter sp. RFBJ5]PPF92822.1 pyridine nucleotide-disulfide oxidoreductase [Pseudoclavibacter sp. RFBJ3]PPF98105.1 pyridine nucleotide-disulfide oxidoreductase [Pseudoclavibacter sp. RFBH5]PPG25175.1 pyridine nucleotide-disulfide oxidoreductase [Pseudoclavibacter sp. RFBI4]
MATESQASSEANVPPTGATTFDVIVIGAGPVGENVADRTVQGGLSTLIVEKELVGGECSYWACIPSKALLRSGAALRAARAVPGSREAATGDLDVSAVLARRDSYVSEWSDEGQVAWLADAGIELVRGHARLTGEREVTVGETTYSARVAVVVATGSAALLPDIPGLADAEPWTSREATSLERIPESITIIGGGVVAVEIATAYTDLGAQVTLVARSTVLGSFEAFAGEAVVAALRSRGATIITGAAPAGVVRDASGRVTVTLDDGRTLESSELLVATGRVPRTGDVGLETAGLESGAWIDVDDTMLVRGSDWLYAAGDVNHRALLTHQGKYQARAAGDAIAARAAGRTLDDGPWGTHVATADHAAVPQLVYSDPEVAAVGLTAGAAEKQGLRVRAVDVPIGNVSGASLHAEGYEGTARMVVDEDRQVVVGFTMVGPDVGELLHAATIAVVGEVPLSRLWHAVPSFPTISELWLRLLEGYGRPQ